MYFTRVAGSFSFLSNGLELDLIPIAHSVSTLRLDLVGLIVVVSPDKGAEHDLGKGARLART